MLQNAFAGTELVDHQETTTTEAQPQRHLDDHTRTRPFQFAGLILLRVGRHQKNAKMNCPHHEVGYTFKVRADGFALIVVTVFCCSFVPPVLSVVDYETGELRCVTNE